MATIPEHVSIELEGQGFLQPIERHAIWWLAQRRHDDGTWHRNWNRALRVRRRSPELFDVAIHAIRTNGPNEWHVGSPAAILVEEACVEFAKDGLISQVPLCDQARSVFLRVVQDAMNAAEAATTGMAPS
ncbi:hypothetical protein ACPWT1_03105 [Ramlibacter sp. MMS24-I3-19]|uniref:hypothetical protein n=1 Tax=Ramlibacter sp. MMS24-I3-19 TaxID=3416606 RepID=UPI003D07404E